MQSSKSGRSIVDNGNIYPDRPWMKELVISEASHHVAMPFHEQLVDERPELVAEALDQALDIYVSSRSL